MNNYFASQGCYNNSIHDIERSDSMSDRVLNPLPQIRMPSAGPPEPDLRAQYSEGAAALRANPCNPQNILPLSKVLRQALAPYAEVHGELVVNVNSPASHFEMAGKPTTNFAAVLLAVIQKHFTDHMQYDFELLIWGQHLPPKIIRIEAKRLRSSAWLDELGQQYICESGIRNIQILLQVMSQYAPVTDEFLYNGWIIDGRSIYVMNGKQLNGDNWNAETAQVPCLHALEMLDVAPHSLTIPLLAIALLSLVQSRMMIQGEYFKGVCCIVAPTQSFKTTLASLFFNFENGREAGANFEATLAAIVRTVGNNRDSTVIIDDLKPGATKAENGELVRKLSVIIRMCSDDSGGIQKAGTQNSTFSNVAHGLVVVTAEQVQLRVQSSLARLLILEMSRKDVDVEKLTYFQEHHSMYREFVADYIRYIAAQGVGQYCEHLAQSFLQERNTLRKELAEDTPVDNRTSDMSTWLWVIFREFLDYARQIKAVTPEEFEAYTREAHTVFSAIMEQQAERVADLAPVKQFFRGIQVLLDTKEAKIGDLQARNSGYAVADSKESIGFSKKGCVYLKNGVALQAVASYYRRLGKDFTVSESSLRKALADSGSLIPKDQKSYIHRLSVNHESYQCIKMERSRFYQLLRGGKRNEAEYDSELPGDRAVRKNAEALLGR